jgi:hypothetical protein
MGKSPIMTKVQYLRVYYSLTKIRVHQKMGRGVIDGREALYD